MVYVLLIQKNQCEIFEDCYVDFGTFIRYCFITFDEYVESLERYQNEKIAKNRF